jgi:nucleotide-binding universal stress UspA family protein
MLARVEGAIDWRLPCLNPPFHAWDSAMFGRILVAADGSHTGARALQIGARLAGVFGARLAVVCVVNTITGFAPDIAWGPRTHESEYVRNGQKLLDLMIEDLPKDLQVERFPCSGDPAIEISRTTNEWGADLLILGRPSHHRLGRLLLGSVEEVVLDHAKCAILVIGPESVATA